MRLFEPCEISFRIAYPELASNENFSRIADNEYPFIWYMGCKDSPIYAAKNKVLEALKLVPNFTAKLSKEEYTKYISGEMPEHIKTAITEIGKFNPDVREKAKVFTDRYLEYANKVTTMNIDDYMGVDGIRDLKTFMDLQTSIATVLPEIVRSSEFGFGFTKKGKEKETDAYKFLENR